MRTSLIIDMVNISKIATNHKMDDQQSSLYFNTVGIKSIKGLLSTNHLTEQLDTTLVSTAAAISARRNRQRI